MRRLSLLAALAGVAIACGIAVQQHQARVADTIELSRESARTLFADGEFCTSSVLKVDAPVRAHYHAEHEEIVQIVRGLGRMRLGDTWQEVGPEDVIYVPKGTVHEFEPITLTVTAVSTFAPSHDGSDYVWIEE